MNQRIISEGELLHDDENPDLEREFMDFADSIRKDQTAEGYVKIWRVPLDADGNPRSNSMQQSLLTTLPLGTMSIDDVCNIVRRKYMRPGEVKMTICARGYQKGKSGHRFQQYMTIERENEPDEPKGGSTTADVAAMLKMIQQSNEAQAARTESFMREMMTMQRTAAVPVPPTTDPIQMMQQVGTMMTIFQGMFAGMMRPPGAVEAVNPMNSFVTQLEQFQKVQKLLGAGGADAEDTGAVGIMKAATPLIAPVLQLLAAQAANKPMKRRQLPIAPKPAQPAPTARPTESQHTNAPGTPDVIVTEVHESMNEDDMMKIRDALNELCDMAARNDDPVAAAALALDMMPDEYDSQVGSLVSEPETFLGKLKLLAPRTAQFPTWFESLRAEMARAYEQDPDGRNDDEDKED